MGSTRALTLLAQDRAFVSGRATIAARFHRCVSNLHKSKCSVEWQGDRRMGSDTQSFTLPL
jgi:hypothetical protein